MADAGHEIEERNGADDPNWTPVVGPETIDFLSHSVPEAAQGNLRRSAVSILSKAVPPNSPEGRETGLIVGYVQSGKTMSFETVAALARDNQFQIVIVVAGIANPLLEQSTGRLKRDLRLEDGNRPRRWVQFQNPNNDDATRQAIRDVLDDWRDPATPHQYKKTLLITVLKNYRRLESLANLFGSLNLREVPALIIDDEADQASLNTEVAQGRESATYRFLMQMRQAIPLHTYLQYTATPQAPLLINIIDALSPNFVEVLEPGNDYVGGRDFFDDNLTHVRIIPAGEVPTTNNPLNEPPETLLEAIRVFMVGVAIGIEASGNMGNRSMLVHPSHRTEQHQEYYAWVREIFDDWKRILNLRDDDPDKQQLLQEFSEAYNDIAQTAHHELPPFDTVATQLRFAFRNTRVLEVNARGGATPEVDWKSSYGWILVGGQAMDRGFTVEGLTVTYMPRGIGVGNADTVQQRARFFGYKRRYLGFCRVYLEQGTVTAFQNYVRHEEDIRGQLQQFQQGGRPLDEWKRAFILDRGLRPCRNNVIEFDYVQGRFSDEWVSPRVVLSSDAVLAANRQVIRNFTGGLQFREVDGHPDRTPIQRHQVCEGFPLSAALERLLVLMRLSGVTDSQRNTGLLLQISRVLDENPGELCSVYLMSPIERRHRGIDENGEITNLFQGEAPVQPRERRGEVYPGDRAIRDQNNITIQLHTLNLTRNGQPDIEDVPVVAVWVPARFAEAWLVQREEN